MLLAYNNIPHRLLTPLAIETEIEYTIDSEKFPGLQTLSKEPTLVVASRGETAPEVPHAQDLIQNNEVTTQFQFSNFKTPNCLSRQRSQAPGLQVNPVPAHQPVQQAYQGQLPQACKQVVQQGSWQTNQQAFQQANRQAEQRQCQQANLQPLPQSNRYPLRQESRHISEQHCQQPNQQEVASTGKTDYCQQQIATSRRTDYCQQQSDAIRRLSFGHSPPETAKRPCYGLRNSVSQDNTQRSSVTDTNVSLPRNCYPATSLNCLDPFDDSFRTTRNDGTSLNYSKAANSAIPNTSRVWSTSQHSKDWTHLPTRTNQAQTPMQQQPNGLNGQFTGRFVPQKAKSTPHGQPVTSTPRTHIEVYGVEGGQPQLPAAQLIPHCFINAQSRKRPLPKDSPIIESTDFDEYSCPPKRPTSVSNLSQARSTIHYYGQNGCVKKPIVPRQPKRRQAPEPNIPPPNAHINDYLIRSSSKNHPGRSFMRTRPNLSVNNNTTSHRSQNATSLVNECVQDQRLINRATDFQNSNLAMNTCVTSALPVNRCVTSALPVNSCVTNDLPVNSCVTNDLPVNSCVTNDLPVNSCVTNDTFLDILRAQWRAPLDTSAIQNH